MAELAGLFLASFAAATLIPLPSEAALFAYLQAHPESAVLAVTAATVGNTAGGMTSYLIGRLIPPKQVKGVGQVKKYGAPILLLTWLPFVGDALGVAAGWLRIHWLPALCFMAAGRLARYCVVAWIA
jgi:membrane protein YqaA with SNARE-associated domain